MIKKCRYLFIIIFISFFNINTVNAETCAQIDEKITLYNDYTQALSELDCEDNSNSDNVIACNNYNINRNLVITDLMKENEKGNICDNQKDKVDKIINENKNKCGKIFDDDFSNFVNGVMTIFYILGPIFLILFGSLDYSKAVVSSEADALKKANKNFAKRLAATILLFLSPAIVNIIISLNVSGKYLSGNAYSCDFNYLVFQKEYVIRYVPRVNKSSLINLNGSSFEPVTNEKERQQRDAELTSMLNTKYHVGTSEMQNGPFPEYWSKPYNLLSPFQCTWWGYGRASQYLEKFGTVYKKLPEEPYFKANGGDYYNFNISAKNFEYGSKPRPNSIISWTSGSYGHVAYVEGVSDDGHTVYVSHAGSGISWKGVTALNDGYFGSGYKLNGYIYLDRPIEK